MELQVIATGSTGNCYALWADGKALLLDAGIPAKKIIEGVHYKLDTVIGCLITHEHKDHCLGAEGLYELGVEIYGSRRTKKALPFLIPCSGNAIALPPFAVMPFPVRHDALEPCGWLITNRCTGERMMYATDTCGLYNTFPGLHYWLIECNYMDELLTDDMPAAVLNRLGESHMSLDRLRQVLEANDLSPCKKIVICHGSAYRLDGAKAVETLRKATGKPVVMAKAEDRIWLEIEPF